MAPHDHDTAPPTRSGRSWPLEGGTGKGCAVSHRWMGGINTLLFDFDLLFIPYTDDPSYSRRQLSHLALRRLISLGLVPTP